MITGIDVGGAETQLLLLCKSLKKRGHTVIVCSMTKPKDLVHEFESLGIPVYDLGMKEGVPSMRGFINWLKLLLKHKPDLVHSHMIHANILSRLSNLILRNPLVNTAHSVVEGGKFLEFIYRSTKYIPNLFSHVSVDGYETYIKKKLVCKQNFIQMENGIQIPQKHVDQFKGKNYSSPYRFIHVARLEEVKNQRLLLDSLSRLGVDYQLDILGDGSLRQELENYARQLGIYDKVQFHGAVRNVGDFLSRSDAFVLTSKYEGLPMSVLEAMAYGLPIVSTDVGDLSQLVTNNCNGFLVQHHTPDDFSKALEEMMSLSDFSYSKMCSVSYKIVSRSYSIDSIGLRWEKIYNEL
ncbi:glycosyltransferase [Vibrio chagasii]|uniref:glycosyltransferase n=1 Tax=Vibrio chagasii TaxID=170679 RepID=UPI003DA95C99